MLATLARGPGIGAWQNHFRGEPAGDCEETLDGSGFVSVSSRLVTRLEGHTS
jgi:hypothetical protein